jgi:EAL domain-containing protein (putative c-di-GMP-specific phosphodiesterase class I)
MSASVGIAISPADGNDMETLLRSADAAMRRAKLRGKNSYQFYDRTMKQASPAALELESDFRRALEREELLLHYQPKVDCLTGQITGFEALVRWQHPVRGLIPPNDFVPMAERTGMIMALGKLVLRLACKQAKAWRDEDLPVVRMSVNLSANEFRTSRIADTVAQIAQDTPLNPRFLDIEITESAMMENRAAAVTALAQMKGIGITVAIDDFGTGYSSLSYLKGFPVDAVKIDQSFIRDITRDSDDAAITAAIISMAKTLKLQVVAEGVETEEQLQFLRSRGCDEMQGFLVSKAVPAGEATEMLRQGTLELPEA